MKIAIGIPTYNDSTRIADLIITLKTFTDFDGDYSIVMLDDGSEKKECIQELKEFGEANDIPVILNGTNQGIPYSWNRLTEYYKDAEYVVLFNDDIQICSPVWLKNIIYFLENNKNAGAVGIPLIHIEPTTGKRNMDLGLPDETVQPGRVGAPVGCSFAFRKSLWEEIKQPDGSTGFWESLKSFYEETDAGFELARAGHPCYMLPTPSCEHWGSMTFASNAELSIRSIIDYLPKDEYLGILEKGQDKLSLPFSKHVEQAENGKAFRMDYSRVMFAKKWGCEDKLEVPQVEVHKRYVDVLPKENIKWIDVNGEEREAMI